MQKLWSLLLFLIIASPAVCQGVEGNQSIEISTESLQKANKKVQKELDRVSKKLRRRLEKAYPSLPKEDLDSLIKADIQSRKEELKRVAKDSATNYLNTLKEDLMNDLKETPEKLPVANEIRESVEKLDEIKGMQAALKEKGKIQEMLDISELNKLTKKTGELKSAFGDYKSQFEGWDEKLLEEITNLPQAKLMKEQMDKMKSYKALPEGYRENLEKFQTNDFVKSKLEEKAEEFKKIGETSLQEKFNEAQAKMTEAKQKFPSLESLEDAPKRYNPYKGQPFFQRLKLGGNMQVNRQKPVSLDLAINLTYPLDNKTAIGVSGATRFFVEKPKAPQTKDQATSIRSFVKYNIWKAFYLQGNYEFTKLQKEDINENSLGEQWVQSALLGIGKRFKVSEKIQMNFTLFYDFFYNQLKSPNNQPWVMRIGFGFGKQ